MGIRVNKVIGYGWTDVKTDADGQITDKRFNPKGAALAAYDKQVKTKRWSAAAYFRRVESVFRATVGKRKPCPIMERSAIVTERRRQEESEQAQRNNEHIIYEGDGWHPHEAMVHEAEFGLPNVFVLVTYAGRKDWRRHDDTIDYAEESTTHRAEPRVLLLPDGIYPHTGGAYRHRKTGKLIGVEDYRYLEDRLPYVAEVPEDIKVLAKHLELFDPERPKLVDTLVPLLYVYWA